MSYIIPIGTPIGTCRCGQRVCRIESGKTEGKTVRTILVTYSRDSNEQDNVFEKPVTGEPHICASRDGSATCRGCNQRIRWETTANGHHTPVNLDGSTHWATCPASDQFHKGKPHGNDND